MDSLELKRALSEVNQRRLLAHERGLRGLGDVAPAPAETSLVPWVLGLGALVVAYAAWKR